jgi:hypothetical protein
MINSLALTLLMSVPAPLPSSPPWQEAVTAVPGADSARLARLARHEQERFERFRRHRLPRTEASGGGECDERLGRFCLRYGGAGPDRTPPPEPEAVAERRERLLERLSETALRQPGDAWVVGQRVFYLIEAGRPEEARRAVEHCAAAPWWCAALLGYVHHESGAYAEAEAAFDRALAAMPPPQAERWSEIGVLLDSDDRRTLRRMDAHERAAMLRRLWWLADPLWMVSGNERRSEHFARRVHAEVRARAASAEGISWGRDLEELILRYGPPIDREWMRGPVFSPYSESMVFYFSPRGRPFLPRVRPLAEGGPAAVDLWPDAGERSRDAYAPGYTEHFGGLEPQVAVFRRGVDAVLVAGFDIQPDSAARGEVVDLTLFVATSEDAAPARVRIPESGLRGAVAAVVPAAPSVYSLEAMATGSRRAFRDRRGLVLEPLPAGEAAISDILLLRDAEPLPHSLEDAVPRARGSDVVRAGETVGLYWELYNVAGEAAVSVTLEGETGRLRRFAEAVGLAASRAPLRVRWRERPDGDTMAPRSLTIRIPDLRPGVYRLRVSAAVARGEPLVAERRIQVASEPLPSP